MNVEKISFHLESNLTPTTANCPYMRGVAQGGPGNTKEWGTIDAGLQGYYTRIIAACEREVQNPTHPPGPGNQPHAWDWRVQNAFFPENGNSYTIVFWTEETVPLCFFQ